MPETQGPSEEPLRFVVVDDNPKDRDMMGRALRTLGEVEQLAGGEGLLEVLQVRPAALICLDMLLPETSGYQVCRQLRDAGVGSLVLAINERASLTDRAYAKEVGADDVLDKPFRVRELMRRVDYLLRMHREAQGG